jgi:hypothetical protein
MELSFAKLKFFNEICRPRLAEVWIDDGVVMREDGKTLPRVTQIKAASYHAEDVELLRHHTKETLVYFATYLEQVIKLTSKTSSSEKLHDLLQDVPKLKPVVKLITAFLQTVKSHIK